MVDSRAEEYEALHVTMAGKITRRRFLKTMGGGVLGLGATAIGGTTWATKIEPDAVETTFQTIPLAHLPVAFDGLTLVQVSDWHLGTWMTLDRMLAIARQANALNPDVLVMTGDFLTRFGPTTFDDITASMAAFTAKESVLAILGNHDHWTSAAKVGQALGRVPAAKLLLNEHIVLTRGTDHLYIAGVDDIWEQKNDLGKALNGIPTDAAVILLAHEPDYADEVAATGRVGLQLSGHSHGGQVRLPFIGAPITPPLGQKYDMGLYNVAGMALYTNRGLGMVSPDVRFNCRPEITHFTLKVV